jgi:hypothetical protein
MLDATSIAPMDHARVVKSSEIMTRLGQTLRRNLASHAPGFFPDAVAVMCQAGSQICLIILTARKSTYSQCVQDRIYLPVMALQRVGL